MYYIYHIPERNKIGVTDDVSRRMREHEWDGFYEILEEHDCIYKVSDRERELQKEYGYKLDPSPYWKSIKIATFDTRSKGGNTNVANGNIDKMNEMRRKLDYQKAEYIRAQYKRGNDVFGNRITLTRLGEVFGVGKSTIGRIVNNEIYTTP